MQLRHLMYCTLFLAVMVAMPLPAAYGQASPTASEELGMEVFGGVGVVHPDYASDTSELDHAILFGGDIAVPVRILPVTPALEIRSDIASGTAINEKSYEVGLRLQRGFGRWTPYGNFLFGLGTIHFNDAPDGYTGDRSKVYSGGGGVKLQVTHSFSAMFDAQYQSWNLGQGPGVSSPVRLHPTGASVGIVYRIPFHGPRGQPKNDDLPR